MKKSYIFAEKNHSINSKELVLFTNTIPFETIKRTAFIDFHKTKKNYDLSICCNLVPFALVHI